MYLLLKIGEFGIGWNQKNVLSPSFRDGHPNFGTHHKFSGVFFRQMGGRHETTNEVVWDVPHPHSMYFTVVHGFELHHLCLEAQHKCACWSSLSLQKILHIYIYIYSAFSWGEKQIQRNERTLEDV